MLLLLPLSTERTDAQQGTLARQLPALLADHLRSAGCSVLHRPLQARRGGRLAHVLLVEPLPDDALDELLSSCEITPSADGVPHDPRAVIHGFVHLKAGELTLRLVQRRADSATSSALLDVRVPRVHLADALDQAARALLELHSRDAPTDPTPWRDVPSDALLALMSDMDNEALATDDWVSHFTSEDDAWRWALRAFQLAPSWPLAQERLSQRIRTLCEAGLARVGLRAATAFATSPQATVDHRRAATAWIVRYAEPGEHVRYLEEVAMHPPVPALTSLRLGQGLLRAGEASDAILALEAAREDEGLRDEATAWLGVALASTGEVDRACALWEGLEEEASDEVIRTMARENLKRARPIQDRGAATRERE